MYVLIEKYEGNYYNYSRKYFDITLYNYAIKINCEDFCLKKCKEIKYLIIDYPKKLSNVT